MLLGVGVAAAALTVVVVVTHHSTLSAARDAVADARYLVVTSDSRRTIYSGSSRMVRSPQRVLSFSDSSREWLWNGERSCYVVHGGINPADVVDERRLLVPDASPDREWRTDGREVLHYRSSGSRGAPAEGEVEVDRAGRAVVVRRRAVAAGARWRVIRLAYPRGVDGFTAPSPICR